MNDKFKPLPRNINKEKLEQFSKGFSVELFSPDVSPVSQFITEYSIKVHERLEDEVFGVCSEIALANGIKYEYSISKEFVVEALKKAIAIKPTEQGEQKAKTLLGEMWLNNGKCPNCHEKVVEFEKYCCECGQKLDWSEINEPTEPTETNFEACQTDFD